MTTYTPKELGIFTVGKVSSSEYGENGYQWTNDVFFLEEKIAVTSVSTVNDPRNIEVQFLPEFEYFWKKYQLKPNSLENAYCYSESLDQYVEIDWLHNVKYKT